MLRKKPNVAPEDLIYSKEFAKVLEKGNLKPSIALIEFHSAFLWQTSVIFTHWATVASGYAVHQDDANKGMNTTEKVVGAIPFVGNTGAAIVGGVNLIYSAKNDGDVTKLLTRFKHQFPTVTAWNRLAKNIAAELTLRMADHINQMTKKGAKNFADYAFAVLKEIFWKKKAISKKELHKQLMFYLMHPLSINVSGKNHVEAEKRSISGSETEEKNVMNSERSLQDRSIFTESGRFIKHKDGQIEKFVSDKHFNRPLKYGWLEFTAEEKQELEKEEGIHFQIFVNEAEKLKEKERTMSVTDRAIAKVDSMIGSVFGTKPLTPKNASALVSVSEVKSSQDTPAPVVPADEKSSPDKIDLDVQSNDVVELYQDDFHPESEAGNVVLEEKIPSQDAPAVIHASETLLSTHQIPVASPKPDEATDDGSDEYKDDPFTPEEVWDSIFPEDKGQQPVAAQAVEAQAVEAQAVEAQAVEAQAVEAQAVEAQAVAAQSVATQAVVEPVAQMLVPSQAVTPEVIALRPEEKPKENPLAVSSKKELDLSAIVPDIKAEQPADAAIKSVKKKKLKALPHYMLETRSLFFRNQPKPQEKVPDFVVIEDASFVKQTKSSDKKIRQKVDVRVNDRKPFKPAGTPR